MKTPVLVCSVAAACLLLFSGSAIADPPGIINHQGRVTKNGSNIDGTGYFKFALVKGDQSETLWSNDGTGLGFPGGEPVSAISIQITKGHYSLGLGDTTITNMTSAVSANFFEEHDDVLLRVWFSTDSGGPFEQLAPDRRLHSVPYALAAETFSGDRISGLTSLGIGTDEPNATLEIRSLPSVRLVANAFQDSCVELYALDGATPRGFVFRMRGFGNRLELYRGTTLSQSRLMWWDESGNVNFGGTRDEILGKLQLLQSTDDNAGGLAVVNSSQTRAVRLWVDDDDVSHLDSGGGNETLTLNITGGRVGIGTATPNFGTLQIIQSTDDISGGLAVVNSTETRAVRIWADASNVAHVDSGIGETALSLNSAGGKVGIGTDTPAQSLHVVGNIVATGVVVQGSDRNRKETIGSVDPGDVLEKVTRLPIERWHYKDDPSATAHMGPMAQDFRSAFELGEDDKHIATVDVDGVALAAIQGLNQKVEQRVRTLEDSNRLLAKQLAKRNAENHELKGKISDLEIRLARLERDIKKWAE